jgi:hypothetical protein
MDVISKEKNYTGLNEVLIISLTYAIEHGVEILIFVLFCMNSFQIRYKTFLHCLQIKINK